MPFGDQYAGAFGRQLGQPFLIRLSKVYRDLFNRCQDDQAVRIDKLRQARAAKVLIDDCGGAFEMIALPSP